MNEAQFEAIQERWAKASSGPWTVSNPWSSPPNEKVINTYEEAVAARIVTNKDEWMRWIEGVLRETKPQEEFESDIMGRMRFVYAMPPRLVIGKRKSEDKSIAQKGHSGGDEPIPAFFVGSGAKEDDVAFIRTAAEDMGALLLAFEAHRDTIQDLEARLGKTTADLIAARALANQHLTELRRLQNALHTIRTLVPPEAP